MARPPYPRFKSCPCGSGRPYGQCCAPAHDGTRPPGTPEALVRARYCAYALGDVPFLVHTWHPLYRPAELRLREGTRYRSLDIVRAHGQEVEFTAVLTSPDGQTYRFHERSRFARLEGRWVYVQGVHPPTLDLDPVFSGP